MQADGAGDLNHGGNRGDAGDAFPGTNNNRTFNATSSPSSKSYADVNTDVSITEISASSPRMTARVAVRKATVTTPTRPPVRRRPWWEWLGFAPGQVAGLPQQRSLPPELMQQLLMQYGMLDPRAAAPGDPGSVDSAWQQAVEERMEAIE